jgi:hypothetical protein
MDGYSAKNNKQFQTTAYKYQANYVTQETSENMERIRLHESSIWTEDDREEDYVRNVSIYMYHMQYA